MPSAENLYSHPSGSPSHRRNSSLTSLKRLPGVARAKLQHLAHATPFVRFMDDTDGQDKDETDIYRNKQQTSDQVFTFERWNKHRNSMRYAKHLAHMFTSRVFKQLLGPVLAVMTLALAVGVYETLASAGALPRHWPHVTLALGQGFNLTAFALSLLLVFRTNSSYDRWWEARKLWGGVVNRTRDCVRQSLVFFRDEDPHLKELLARWTMAFPKVLMCHLREDMDVAKEVAHILTAYEVEVMCAAAHRPNFVLQVMAEIVRAGCTHELNRMRMDENLTFFEDAMGSCERILRTPIPLSYTRHTSRFLLVWLILLPFTLWAAYSWFSILLSGIFAFLMFGIDEIGVQIEEPFGILPLEAICATIERNIRELMVRNIEVAALVRQHNLPAGTTAELAVQLVPVGSDAAAAGAVGPDQGDEFEFGEMTGAITNVAADDGEELSSKAGVAPGAPGGLISLMATSTVADATWAPRQTQPGVRRVQFGPATVIDVSGSTSMDDADGGMDITSLLAARAGTAMIDDQPRPLMHSASLMEVELASGASPEPSPRDGTGARGSSYTSWLHD